MVGCAGEPKGSPGPYQPVRQPCIAHHQLVGVSNGEALKLIRTSIMKNDIISFAFENHSVRSVELNQEPWFIASDVCEALALHPSQIRKLDNDEKGLYSMQTPGGIQELSIISESGLYFLTIRCRDAVKPGTLPHRFRKWVINEVLPLIRKSGQYQQQPSTYMFDGRLLLTVKNGCLVSSKALAENEHVLTLEDYLELAGRAGYIVIHEDDLKAMAAAGRCSFPERLACVR